MLSLSYNLSPTLRELLDRIDHLRTRTLLAPLPPLVEMRLRWNAMVDRVYFGLLLCGSTMEKRAVAKLLASQDQRKLSREEKEVLKYREAIRFIQQEWLASPKSVTVKTVEELHNMACYGSFSLNASDLRQLLEYLQTPHQQGVGQTQSDHPVIEAAVAQAQMLRMVRLGDPSGKLIFLLPRLFLYKQGYDVRGMLAVEKEFYKDGDVFTQHVDQVVRSAYVTVWIEYVAQALAAHLEAVAQDIAKASGQQSSFFDLSDRQKAILGLLETPDTTITNRKVQRQFKVSQITASRDLSKLTALGLLFAHGKGRSVYYTRV